MFNIRTSYDVFKTKTRRKLVDEIGPRLVRLVLNINNAWVSEGPYLQNGELHGGCYDILHG